MLPRCVGTTLCLLETLHSTVSSILILKSVVKSKRVCCPLKMKAWVDLQHTCTLRFPFASVSFNDMFPTAQKRKILGSSSVHRYESNGEAEACLQTPNPLNDFSTSHVIFDYIHCVDNTFTILNCEIIMNGDILEWLHSLLSVSMIQVNLIEITR